MAEYIVNFRQIVRFSDGRVRTSSLNPSKSDNDEMMEKFKSNLKWFGYKCVGRSKDEHGNFNETYEQKDLLVSLKDREVISRITITKLK